MKVGLIRCLQTEDMCPANGCLAAAKNKAGSFSGVQGAVEYSGVTTCGGCPGKKAVTRAATMVQRGAGAIALASCISRGTPIGFACPHKAQMLAAIRAKLGGAVPVFEYTHD